MFILFTSAKMHCDPQRVLFPKPFAPTCTLGSFEEAAVYFKCYLTVSKRPGTVQAAAFYTAPCMDSWSDPQVTLLMFGLGRTLGDLTLGCYKTPVSK